MVAQVNKIRNGGFEKIDTCMAFSGPVAFINNAQYWDTLKNGGGYGFIMHRCLNPNTYCGVPYNLQGGGYQEPHSGSAYSYTSFLKLTPNPAVNWRGYSQQKLASKLTAGKSYCVTYWASLVNYVNYGVDELGAYFDDGSIQSIAWAHEAIANPQVKSPTGVFYTDTLNWMKVEGSFVANGTEEYITIGNFRYTSATTFTALDGNWSSGTALYFIDDVSVIETNLPAYAGADKYVIPGDSVFIGRPSEIGLDDNCFWYKLPNTTTPIDTVAGLWVKPVVTTTYVVKQDICGTVKWDTVVVNQSGVGLNELSYAARQSKLYPNPTTGEFSIELTTLSHTKTVEIFIYDLVGKLLLTKTELLQQNNLKLNPNLTNGTYLVKVKLPDGTIDIHRLIVE